MGRQSLRAGVLGRPERGGGAEGAQGNAPREEGGAVAGGAAHHPRSRGPQPWQSFIETTFGIRKRVADFGSGRAKTWEDVAAKHDLWPERQNAGIRGTRRRPGGRGPGGA